eukprot:TRINITY_DN20544_c0_g1_i2.p1 TRINITY_DN20544_c0_g1~~TRINITY_DN20544_c0_g1_i2.p1  ORF type:complete len:308 (-),score=64.32 TRINITY_DN20544_c0_g1_i2:69-992(-)
MCIRDRSPIGLYVLGGGNSTSQAFDHFETYNPISGEWKLSSKPMQLPRMSGVAVAAEDSIFVFGGGNGGQDRFSTGEVYSTSTRSWSALPSMRCARSGCAVVASAGKLLVLGGLNGEEVFRSVEAFDVSTQSWSQGASLHTRRFGLAAAVLGESIFALGGGTGSQILNSVEVLKADLTGSWELWDSFVMPTARLGAGVAVVNDLLFIAGGFNTEGGHLNTVDCFDQNSQVWNAVAPMQFKRSSCMVAALEDRLVVCGGYDGSARTHTVEQFNPETGQWTQLGDICLLYTSDAADEEDSVDLGGCRFF